MGLTFKKQDELEKLFDKFATVPEDKKKKIKQKNNQNKKDN
ncbi:SPJ_0845 family protein [Lactobacillus sp. ESL0684]|nr:MULTISPECIES: SPJ_0845 family protein [unclassified Lactobacillus]WEV40625.1 SPJ_0845 family protein [Lactobacillus sp. ESL0681]WEV42855.1 SPJ_0845 family protein [Lactobacillus sp. ESL0684]